MVPVAADVRTTPAISSRMSRQARRDTAPEIALRRALHRRGLRYRVHWSILGMPRRRADIAFPRSRVAIFVDGCFWHGCPDHGTDPKSNAQWWAAKLAGNRHRDEETAAHMGTLGWTVFRFWEHADMVAAADLIETAVRAAGVGQRRRYDEIGGRRTATSTEPAHLES